MFDNYVPRTVIIYELSLALESTGGALWLLIRRHLIALDHLVSWALIGNLEDSTNARNDIKGLHGFFDDDLMSIIFSRTPPLVLLNT